MPIPHKQIVFPPPGPFSNYANIFRNLDGMIDITDCVPFSAAACHTHATESLKSLPLFTAE